MNEKLIDKIRKLIAHERSARAIGNPEEAAAFAARIQELLCRHKISIAEVEMQPEATREVVGESRIFSGARAQHRRARRTWWRDDLLSVVARAHFCETICYVHTNMTCLIGREADRAVTIAMNDFLVYAMTRLCARVVRERRRRSKLFRRSFYQGFIAEISRRYKEQRESESMALILRQSKQEVEDHMRQNHPGAFMSKPDPLGRLHLEGLAAGHSAARDISLSANTLKQSKEHYEATSLPA